MIIINGVEIITESKRTPLYDSHIALGAKMVDFAGFIMPVQYESIIKEHVTVRNNAGIFDISHMGEFLLEGEDIFPFLQYVMINDLKLWEPSKGQYSCMCYENGTVVDDLVYYEETPQKFRMIVNASNVEKDFKWLNSHIRDWDVKITDLSKQRARIALQGPKSDDLLQTIVDTDLSNIDRFYFRHCKLNGLPIFIARTGYTGEKGFELSMENQHALTIWKTLMELGAKPAGLGARDSLRLEASYSLYGHEINDKITPIEAGLFWLVKPKEGIDYIGKDVLLEQKSKGTKRILVGLTLIDRGIIRQDYKIYKDGNEIGYVTSGGFSPTLQKTIGLGLIDARFKEINTEVQIEIRDKLLKGLVTSTPFYRNV
jgi:aminomethyltransferase